MYLLTYHLMLTKLQEYFKIHQSFIRNSKIFITLCIVYDFPIKMCRVLLHTKLDLVLGIY